MLKYRNLLPWLQDDLRRFLRSGEFKGLLNLAYGKHVADE